MSDRNEEFVRIANAERQLCDDAGPAIAAIIRAIEARAGLCITELRVTLDPAHSSNGSMAANCTIVRAHAVGASDGHNIQRAIGPTGAPSNGLSSDHD